MKRDFLRLRDLTLAEHERLLERAAEHKRLRAQRVFTQSLAGRTLALVFEKASTRTRVSFEAAMAQLGGTAINLSIADSQLGRGEPIEDTAKVLSGYVDAIVFRTFGDDRLALFAKQASVPVINGLSDAGHPVQLLADLLTVKEHFGTLKGLTFAFVGDGTSNMALSWIEAAQLFAFQLHLATPAGFEPPPSCLESGSAMVKVTTKPQEAVRQAQVVNTDVWTSMGQEADTVRRKAAFAGFCVDTSLLALADRQAVVLHCLPAHRGEEISAEVLEGPQSLVFTQAENRMHAQKALLELLLNDRT
jgi:ornithine carbamoyltransferase